MKVVKTGIPGLDSLFAAGGYPKGNTILVLGGPGSGKSIFGMQYLYVGATEYDENGLFVAFEESPEKIKRNMLCFGWNIEEMIEQGKLAIMDATSYIVSPEIDTETLREGMDIDNLIANLEDAVKELNAERLVIDSLSVMNLYAKDEFERRRDLLKLTHHLGRMNVTSLVITEAKNSRVGIKEFPLESYVFDGVITLTLDPDNQTRRLSIRKMRGTKHVLGSFRFSITSNGIELSA